MLKIRLLDKHGKLDVECWEKYDPYYIKVLSDDEVIIHLTVLFVLFDFYIIVCKDTKYFINKRILSSYLNYFNKLMFCFSSNMFHM